MFDDIKDFKIDFNFDQLIRESFIAACSMAKDTATQILKYVDEEIKENVNPKNYKFIKMKSKTILTPFGDLTFERAYYLDRREDEYVYLLDEFLEIKLDGKVTKDALLRIVDDVSSMSYPKSKKDLEEKNMETSIGTIRNRISDFLDKVNKSESQRVEKHLNGELEGNKENKVIFEEKDGLYLSIKGKKKEKK